MISLLQLEAKTDQKRTHTISPRWVEVSNCPDCRCHYPTTLGCGWLAFHCQATIPHEHPKHDHASCCWLPQDEPISCPVRSHSLIYGAAASSRGIHGAFVTAIWWRSGFGHNVSLCSFHDKTMATRTATKSERYWTLSSHLPEGLIIVG
jgi:hypothetical protein